MFDVILYTLKNTMGPTQSGSSDADGTPKIQRKVMISKEKFKLLDMYYRLKAVAMISCHFDITESSIRIFKKKKERKFVKLLLQLHQQVK